MFNIVLHILKNELLQKMWLNNISRSLLATQSFQTTLNEKFGHCVRASPMDQFGSNTSKPLYNHQQRRSKGKKKIIKEDIRTGIEGDLDYDEPENETVDMYDGMLCDKHTIVANVKVKSMRADLLLKAGLGIARNKVDNLFYDSKIRINGKKLMKKSVQVGEDDEIDIIREFSSTNANHLIVSRVEIVSVTPNTENFSVVLRRYKSLTIENYSAGSSDSGKEK